MDRVAALTATLLAGAFIALQPPANALLARSTGDLGAAFLSLSLSTLVVGVLLLAFGTPGDLGNLSGFKWEYVIGGLSGAAVVTVSLITVGELGAAGVTAALVSMQLTVSAVLDRYGALGLDETAIGWQGALGIALLLSGTALLVTR